MSPKKKGRPSAAATQRPPAGRYGPLFPGGETVKVAPIAVGRPLAAPVAHQPAVAPQPTAVLQPPAVENHEEEKASGKRKKVNVDAKIAKRSRSEL